MAKKFACLNNIKAYVSLFIIFHMIIVLLSFAVYAYSVLNSRYPIVIYTMNFIMKTFVISQILLILSPLYIFVCLINSFIDPRNNRGFYFRASVYELLTLLAHIVFIYQEILT